jgi:glycogen debranching enzyme
MVVEIERAGTVPQNESALRFYIPITSSLSERRPRTLKQGDTFGLFDHNGDIVGGQGSPEGLYHEDTRYVSELRLTLNGQPPLLLGSAINDDNSLLSADLTNPDYFLSGKLDQPSNTIYLARARFLWNRGCYERLSVHNCDQQPRRIEIAIEFACDFSDIFEVRGSRRPVRGNLAVKAHGDRVIFAYEGLDRRIRRATFRFEPLPEQMDHNRARFVLQLLPAQHASLFMTIHLGENLDAATPGRCFFPRLRAARRALRRSAARGASVTTSNAVFNEVLDRSMADLNSLVTDTPHGAYPYAGIPWFSTAFGRDGIITAMQMLWVDPELARGVLSFLAATQSTSYAPEADSQPGKILHEMRNGEMAELGEVPFKRYYGSIDSTPLFVMLAGMYSERTGDVATIRALWPSIEAALTWIDTYGDRDNDGFVEYRGEREKSLTNQGWKDSVDSVFHVDGQLAEGPIALCEVQGYVWAAKIHAAKLAEALGQTGRAAALQHEAEVLRLRFEAAFWCEDIASYAIALDGNKKPCRVRSSNAGQVLFSGIASPNRAAKIADQMLDPAFFSGWGIRTIARSESRYNPMSYHNGSIWPHDNALIAAGLCRYGFTHHVQRLFGGIFDAAAYMDLRRLPELFCGFRRVRGRGPTSYPVACAPQAWASATPFALLQACLGIGFDPVAGVIWFRKPQLPDFLHEVVIRGLSVSNGRADVFVHRHGRDVSVGTLRRDGDVSVSVAL